MITLQHIADLLNISYKIEISHEFNNDKSVSSALKYSASAVSQY